MLKSGFTYTYISCISEFDSMIYTYNKYEIKYSNSNSIKFIQIRKN